MGLPIRPAIAVIQIAMLLSILQIFHISMWECVPLFSAWLKTLRVPLFSVAMALMIPIARFVIMFVRQDVRQPVGPTVVKIPTRVTKNMTPLEREL